MIYSGLQWLTQWFAAVESGFFSGFQLFTVFTWVYSSLQWFTEDICGFQWFTSVYSCLQFVYSGVQWFSKWFTGIYNGLL